jgi:hypothetical protein
MRVQPIRLCVAVPFMLFQLSGCSSGGSTGPANTGTTGKTPTTSTYAGTFADSKTSGSLTVSITSSAASASRMLPARLEAQTIASGSATGTLVFLSGATATVSGTYSASTGTLTLSGGGYSFTGALSSGTMTGTYSGPNGSGNFAAAAPSSTGATAKTYCGTYETSSDYGWLNLVISSSGNLSGMAVAIIGATSVGISGSLSGSSLTAATSASVPIQGTLSADGNSVTGTYLPAGAAGSGTFQASTASCVTAGASTVAGLWVTNGTGLSTNLRIALTQSGSSTGGSGVLSVNFVPSWTGDEFEITSGSFSSAQATFTAQLGANPIGNGGFYYGTLSFSGTVTNGSTMTGSVVFTPPRTASQVFAQQTVTGVTLTRY